jgi:PIN domain nuclease of toxin-antitoxin system
VRLLLDTHAYIWFLDGNRRLPERLRGLISAEESFVSAATVWEIGIKHRAGRLPEAQILVADWDHYIEGQGFHSLPMTRQHAALASALEAAHKDPFDRMLAAQAMLEEMHLISCDEAMTGLGVPLLWG